MNDSGSQYRLLSSCTWTWLMLCALTLLTWGVGRYGPGGHWVAMALLAGALLKGQLVGDWFMGLGRIRGFWRWVVSLWLILIGVLISIAFFLASGE